MFSNQDILESKCNIIKLFLLCKTFLCIIGTFKVCICLKTWMLKDKKEGAIAQSNINRAAFRLESFACLLFWYSNSNWDSLGFHLGWLNWKRFETHSFQRGPVNSTFYQSLIMWSLLKAYTWLMALGFQTSVVFVSSALLVLLFLNQVAFWLISVAQWDPCLCWSTYSRLRWIREFFHFCAIFCVIGRELSGSCSQPSLEPPIPKQNLSTRTLAVFWTQSIPISEYGWSSDDSHSDFTVIWSSVIKCLVCYSCPPHAPFF